MTDKILTWVVILLIVINAIEFLISGLSKKAIINTIRVETGSTIRNKSIKYYEENAVYFDSYRITLNDKDVATFNQGDSIEYKLTPVIRNLKTVKKLKSNHQIYVQTYSMLLLLTAMTIVAQALSVNMKWSKTNKQTIQILVFSLIVAIGYLLIFR